MKFADIQAGEILSSTMYVTVQSRGVDSIEVVDTFARKFTIKGKELIEQALQSSIQFTDEKVVSKTRAAEILIGAGDKVFTVEFVKADGTDRVLTGHLLQTENLLGRSDVQDLNITKGNPIRQVDHRTIKSIILEDVKYSVK